MTSYSAGGCEKKHALYSLPERTIEEIHYNFLKNPPKLKNLVKTSRKFKKEPYGDVINQMMYYDETSGIFIYFDRFTKEVNGITIKPSLKNKQKFDCANLK